MTPPSATADALEAAPVAPAQTPDHVTVRPDAPAARAMPGARSASPPSPPAPTGAPAATATPPTPPPRPAENPYLRTKVLTASPEQLQLMLYDGAIRFAEQGRAALEGRQFDQSFEALTRAQRILTELSCSLKPELAPDLCEKLSALYTFAYMRLVDANTNHSTRSVEEALQVLRYQRDTWAMLMQQLSRTKAADVAGTLPIPSSDSDVNARSVERLSVAG